MITRTGQTLPDAALAKYLRFIYHRADVIIAVSESAAAELADLKIRVPVTVSCDAIDERAIDASRDMRDSLRAELGWLDQTVVLAVGQVQPRKGVEEIIKCAQALPEFRFCLGRRNAVRPDARGP